MDPVWSLGVLLFSNAAPGGGKALLKPSDVVFMYHAGAEVYQAYGATVLAWGGSPEGVPAGVTCFGSVGMVTEFARYYERFPETYEQALCRTVEGQPIQVPWLTDHRHQGIPYWWCCTNQPQFQQYLRERVQETVRQGADGVHIDDHLGTAGSLHAGGCFCDRCLSGFRAYLQALPEAHRQALGLPDLASFDYRAYLAEWLRQPGHRESNLWERPLWAEWEAYHLQAAAAFMAELKALAAETAGRPVPFSANAGLLWYPHLTDYQVLDFFSAEIDHEAASRRFSDLPLLAYRLAEGLGRPLAATASGWDWAFVKEHDLDGLVRGWIAESYAAGQFFMAPHYQWCYTSEKGTHWYHGPTESYAPLYRFVREHADLFDGYTTLADVGVLYSHTRVRRNRQPLVEACAALARANISFRLLVAGDALLDHPLSAEALASVPGVLAVDPADLEAVAQAQPPLRSRLDSERAQGRLLGGVEEALAKVHPAVRVEGTDRVRALPRLKPGDSVVIHLLNRDYDPEADDVRPLHHVTVALDPSAGGLATADRCTLFVPGAKPRELPVLDHRVTVPELGLWAVLRWH
jgi:hypothetical protein